LPARAEILQPAQYDILAVFVFTRLVSRSLRDEPFLIKKDLAAFFDAMSAPVLRQNLSPNHITLDICLKLVSLLVPYSKLSEFKQFDKMFLLQICF